VDDPRPEAAALSGDGGRSPRWLRVTALGDWLQQVDPEASVQVVSEKDRAAIILGGQHPDAVWWFDQTHGTGFTTSRWYASALPRWIEDFNRKDFFSEAPAQWTHPAGPGPGGRIDDYPAESPRFERKSPHPVRGGSDPVADTQGMIWSPWGDEVVLRFALEMVEEYDLGQRGHLDVLAISLSSLDFVGHLYGPESLESADALRRIDDWLDEFLDEVEDEVDDDRLWIVLSSDHGGTPIPEWLSETGRSECPIPGGRADLRALGIRLNEHLEGIFGPSDGDWVERSGYRFTVSRSNAAERDVKVTAVVAESRRFLSGQRGLRYVWTADELREGKGPAPFAALYHNSWDEERGGDFEMQPDPDCLFTTYPTGANHGSPYLPDRAVPLVFVGPGITPGPVAGRAATVDLGPTLAAHQGIPIPPGLDGRVLPLGGPAPGR
jgi:predicted AlkP superfamily pyrophosphatase or phosphodiesterase